MAQTTDAPSVALCDTNCGNTNSTLTGAWLRQQSTSQYGYIAANLTDDAIAEAVVTIKLPVALSGNYSILIYTPGCVPDNSCDTRGIVNVTGYLEQGRPQTKNVELQIYQTNDFDKYDPVFNGFISGSTSQFTPYLNITPTQDPSRNGNFYMVAHRASAVLLATADSQPSARAQNSHMAIKIGLGVGLPILLIIIAAAILIVRRRRRLAKLGHQPLEVDGSSTCQEMMTSSNVHEISTRANAHEMPASSDHLELSAQTEDVKRQE